MPAIGTIAQRYPAGDPENGPAYLQRWNGQEWECAAHKFHCYREEDIDDMGNPNGIMYTIEACIFCGWMKD